MFCLMEGRHVHPSTLYPGGVGTTPTIQLFTDYLTRLSRYAEFMKRVVPMHDDVFDFWYEALPGYEEVGRRRVLLGCWGSFQDPAHCDFQYRTMEDWGRKMFVTPGVIVDGKLLHDEPRRHQPRHQHPARLVVLRRLGGRRAVRHAATRWATRSGRATRGTSTRYPEPQKRDFDDKYSWVMSPRWFDGTDYLALDTGGGPIARLWSTALAGLVDIGYIKSTGSSVKITLPKTALLPETEFEWKIPQWSNAIERDRARTYFQAYACAAAYHFAEQALAELRAGNTKTWERFDVPDEAIGCGFTEAVRGVLSHHVVIRDGKIANYHPYPPTPWNANPTDSLGTMGPYEDAVTNTPIFEENSTRRLQGRRHHAGRAQLRPVPAVRRAHVPRGGSDRRRRCTRRPKPRTSADRRP